MEEKEVLETPQINQFKHENVFGNSFKNEVNKTSYPDFIRLNSFNNESQFLPTLVTSVSLNSINSAPKKNLLYRTISSEKQDALKSNESIYSLQFSSPNPIFNKSESLDSNTNFKFNDILSLKRKISENKQADFSIILKDESPIKNPKNEPLQAELENKIDLLQKKTTNPIISTKIGDFYNQNEPQIETIYSKMQHSEKSTSKSRSSSSSNDEVVTSSDQTNDSIKKNKSNKRSLIQNNDLRKQQIRNSNREAARRCRERRRNYIETLEANIRNLESKQKSLLNDNTNLQKEVLNLKKMLSEHKNCNSENKNEKNNQYCLINTENNLNSIIGSLNQFKNVPLVLTLKLPNYEGELVNINSQITTTNINETENTINTQFIQKLLNEVINKNQTSNPKNTEILSQSQQFK